MSRLIFCLLATLPVEPNAWLMAIKSVYPLVWRCALTTGIPPGNSNGEEKMLNYFRANSPAGETFSLKTFHKTLEEARVAALSPFERELENASRDAEAAKQRREDAAHREKVRMTPAYTMLRESLDNSLIIARLDTNISQEVVDSLEDQSARLERTMDLPAIRANVSEIQKAIRGEIALQDAALKEAVSRADLRKKLLASGTTFESVDVELVGSLPFIVLQSGGKTVKVSQERYDNRVSDEALRSELFNEGEVANV